MAITAEKTRRSARDLGKSNLAGGLQPRRALSLFLPPLALVGLIFFLSAQPDLSTGLGFWDVVLRKLAHTVEFGLLALLWARALLGSTTLPFRRALLTGAGIALLYAITDELHQTAVEGRHGSAFDWLVDALGIALATVLALSGRLGLSRVAR